jgi:hypothetical protein
MAIRSAVPVDEERGVAFCCADLELSTDDITAQPDNQWTEVLPTNEPLPPKRPLIPLSNSSVDLPSSLYPHRHRHEAKKSLPHPTSAPNIEALLSESVDQRGIRPLATPKRVTQSHPLADSQEGGDQRLSSASSTDSDPGHGERQDDRSFSDLFPAASVIDPTDRTLSNTPSRLRIIDARPMMNAKGNALMGKGHEIIGRLGGDSCTTLDFADIPNIHVVRESLGALRQIFSEVSGNPNWYQLIHETKWLHYLSLLWKGAIRVALHLESGEPVLVHCSDGWDRTSQLTALAQLLLSPYYRTIEGTDNTGLPSLSHLISVLSSPLPSPPPLA